MAAFEVLDELIEITDSTELHKRMRFWFVQEIVEEEGFVNFIRNRCDDLRRRNAMHHVLIGEMKALGARGVAVDYLDCLKQTQARETGKLAALTEVLAKTRVGIHEKEGHVAKMDLNDYVFIEPLSDVWTDFFQEPLIPGISLKRPYPKSMTDHSQKWHDRTSSRNIKGNSNSEGIAAIVSKLENLGQDMKKLKENVHVIQVGCQNYERAHLDKDFPLNEEVKSVEEAKYDKFGRPSPFSNGAKYHVGPPIYYTCIDNRPPFGENRPSLEELLNKHLKESTRRRSEMEE
nr:hypothetical protein [Tanacetum cinerariifolium]